MLKNEVREMSAMATGLDAKRISDRWVKCLLSSFIIDRMYKFKR